MTITTKYDIGQKVYYPTEEFIDDRGTFKRVVKELVITKIRATACGISYAPLEDDWFIDEYLLFPTEEAAWEEHRRRERVNDSYQDEVMKWGD